MTAKRGLGVWLLAVLATVVVAGCGGGEDDTVTKAEFVREANAVCKEAEDAKNRRLDSAFKLVSEKQGIDPNEEQKLLFDAALPPLNQMVQELADLGAPEGEEEKVEAIVGSFERQVEAIEADPQGAMEGEVGFFREANDLSKKYGLEACEKI